MRFEDADLWDTNSGSIQPNDKLFSENPVKQGDFGVLLALLAHRNLIAAELEEEEESDSEGDGDGQTDVSDDD
jgi:hypothetical protein